MKTFQITAKELLAEYISYKEKCIQQWQTPYLCILILELTGWCPDGTDVINQFVQVKPERFYDFWSNSIVLKMRKKYQNVQDPRLSLLKSINSEHVFTFTNTPWYLE